MQTLWHICKHQGPVETHIFHVEESALTGNMALETYIMSHIVAVWQTFLKLKKIKWKNKKSPGGVSDISGSLENHQSATWLTDCLSNPSTQVTLRLSQSVRRWRIMSSNCLQLTSCHCVPAISGCGRGWLMRPGLFGRLYRQILGSTLPCAIRDNKRFFFFKKRRRKKRHWAARYMEAAVLSVRTL